MMNTKKKRFKYDIDHSNTFRIVEVDVDEYKTVDDFIKIIAQRHNIKSQLKCINKPGTSLLRDINSHYKFNFETNKDDIKFKLIKAYNEKKKIYFSQFCIDNNLTIVYKDGEPRFDLIDEIVVIKFGPKMKFYLANNEKVINACILIEKIIESSEVCLQDINQVNKKMFLDYEDELKSNNEYIIFAYYQAIFLEEKRKKQFNIKMESRSTVLDAKKELAKMYSTERNISIDNIILLDEGNIAEDNKLLRQIHKFKHIFKFKIDYPKAPVERTKRNDFDDSLNVKIEEGQPFEIRKGSNRRLKPKVDYNKSIKSEEYDDKIIKPRKRSDSVQTHLKPQPTQESDSEVSENASKPRKKVNLRKFKPSVTNIPDEPISKTLKKFVPKNNKKRVLSVQKETYPKIEKDETSLIINLVFDELGGYKKRRIIKNFEKITKIKDVIKEIKKAYNLSYVKLKYKNGKYIDQNETLKEIEDDIKEDQNPKIKIKNFIYVETKDKSKEKRDDDDDDDDDDGAYKHRPKTPKINVKIKDKSDDDDDENEDTCKYRPTSKKKKDKSKEKSDDDDAYKHRPKTPKIKVKIKGKSDDDDDESEDTGKYRPTSTKKKNKTKEKDDDDDEDTDKRHVQTAKKKNKTKEKDDDDDDDTDKRHVQTAKKKNKRKEKSDDDDDDEDTDKRHTAATKTKKNSKVKSDDDYDDDDDLPSSKIKNKGKGNQKKTDGTDKYDILATSPKLKNKTKKIDKSDDDDDKIRSSSKNKKGKEESKSKKFTYKYQINGDPEIFEIELDKNATVLKMKQEIAKENHIKNLGFVRIVFAGKELLEELELLPLKIGDLPLFVNIQFEEEVLLLTAKALRDSM